MQSEFQALPGYTALSPSRYSYLTGSFCDFSSVEEQHIVSALVLFYKLL